MDLEKRVERIETLLFAVSLALMIAFCFEGFRNWTTALVRLGR